MKKLVLLIACIVIALSIDAQSYGYYKMIEGSGGSGEWLANSKKWLDYWGIQFTAGAKVRATLSNEGSWYFSSPSSTYSNTYFNSINTRLKSMTDVAIATDNTIAAKTFKLTDIGNNDVTYGSFSVGRGNDPTLQAISDNWLRLGSNKGIAMWGDNRVGKDDSPHVLLESNGTFNVHNNIRALVGDKNDGLFLKRGRNNDPTIRTQNNAWLRIGGKAGVYIWGNDNVENDNKPTLSVIGNKVGIGTGSDIPSFELEVRGAVLANEEGGVQVILGRNAHPTFLAGWMGTYSNHPLMIGTNKTLSMYIDVLQKVYIGMSISEIVDIKPEIKIKYNLFVGGGILSEDYAIAPKSTWSDFVFTENYNLRPLSEVSDFITENKHLPDVPSAQDVAENGYSQHDMNKVLLQKIEELMLYTIEQNKKIDRLESELNNLKTQ